MSQDGPLGAYRAKRDAARTPEPVPEWDVPDQPADHTGNGQAGRGDTFVVQEHHATALHWDVRLERDGVLVSWAVPKGLPVDPKTNHLAKQTEDHPLGYATFAGDIPAGEYGGGKVTVWDHGTYELETWTEREVKVVLHGERVTGRYVFFRTSTPPRGAGGNRPKASDQGPGKPGGGNNWMVHRMDPPQDPDWQPLPADLSPMLATPGALPPDNGHWSYEVKWDGVRMLVYVEGGRVRAVGRSGRDVTVAYPELRAIGLALGSTQALLDGEVVAFGPDGRPDFGLLQQRMHVSDANAARRAARAQEATFLAFDLLHLDGHPTVGLPYDQRRELLEGLPGLTVPPAFTTDGKAVLAGSREQGLEGVVAKRRNATYTPGRRSDTWIKVRNVQRQSVVIGGWEPGEGNREGKIGALLLGVYETAGDTAAGLRYVGQCGTGFTEATLADLKARLAPLASATSPFEGKAVPREYARHAVWLEPALVAEVDYGAWTRDGRLRFASYRGLRDDLDPADVVLER